MGFDFNFEHAAEWFVNLDKVRTCGRVGSGAPAAPASELWGESPHAHLRSLNTRRTRVSPQLIHYVNLNTSVHGVRMFYSTPPLYYDAKAAYPVTWPLTDDGSDLFPYIDSPHAPWTGYTTSRSALKVRVWAVWAGGTQGVAGESLLTFAVPRSLGSEV